MGTDRLPGPVCGLDWRIGSLDDGTNVRWLSPVPAMSPWLDCHGAATPWLSPVQRHAGPGAHPALDVSYLFNSCRMPRRGLSEAALAAAAQDLGVDVAALQAVAEIESAGSGFDEEGRPQILFERHYFHRLTRGRYDKAHPDISHPTRGGYGRLRAQYSRLERAYRLHARASLQSASWGRFQIMGAHYAKLGFDSPQEMVQAMARSEEEHLRAFVALLKTMPAARAGLVSHDWAKFARAYNGKDFAENRYDTKLKAAYERHQSRVAAHGSGASPSPLMLSPRG